MPLLRLFKHRGEERVRLDGVQGNSFLFELSPALRLLQAVLGIYSQLSEEHRYHPVDVRALDLVILELVGNAERNLHVLSLIHISEPTRLLSISYAVFCLKKKK